jgi:hypothetical protein
MMDETPPDSPSDKGPAASTLWRLRLYAERDAQGEIRGIYLLRAESGLFLWQESAEDDKQEPALPLPLPALHAVFSRYGKPLEDGVELQESFVAEDPDDAPLLLPVAGEQTARLRRFRFRPYGWVFPADYLLWEHPGAVPLAAPAPLITSALFALARAASR